MRALIAVVLAACSAEAPREHVPEEGTLSVEANGLTFHYFEEGSGPLVLLVHGFPDTAHTWDDVRPALAEAGFRAVSPFQRGYAPTEVPEQDATAEDLGADVIGLIEALGEEQAFVVGHDWGAHAAYAAVQLAPERVEKLVTVAIPPFATIRRTPTVLWGSRHFLYLTQPSGLRLMQRHDFEHVEELYARWSPTWEVPESEWEPTKNAFALEESLDAALGYYRAASLGGGDPSEISVPTLLVGGLDDGVLPEQAFTEHAQEQLVGELRVEMLPGGHFVHRESPEAFVEVLLEFLAP